MAATEEEIIEFLEHAGVKGMKWGQRRAQQKSLNKASRDKDKLARADRNAKFDKAIDRARARTKNPTFFKDTSKANLAVKKAKADYQANKAALGKREAKKIVAKARSKRLEDKIVAGFAKSGKETTRALLIGVGGLALMGAGRYAQRGY